MPDDLDAIAIRVSDEAEERAAVAHLVRRTLRLEHRCKRAFARNRSPLANKAGKRFLTEPRGELEDAYAEALREHRQKHPDAFRRCAVTNWSRPGRHLCGS